MAKHDVPGYETLEPIGRGAGSTISRAVEVATGDVVAIKQIVAETKEASKYLRHIENEYRNLVDLHAGANGHPGAAKVVGIRQLVRSGRLRKRKIYSIVMDYVPGSDLRRERRYPLGQLLDFLIQSLTALEFIHGSGYVHADLKPENIMVTPQGKVTLIDFGFSCSVGLQAKTIRGTREYMAPEQVDRGIINAQTDLYNLGASFYYLLANQQVPALMPGGSGSELTLISRDIRPEPLWNINPAIPTGVARVIMSCIQLDPMLRPGSALEGRTTIAPLVENLYQDRDAAM